MELSDFEKEPDLKNKCICPKEIRKKGKYIYEWVEVDCPIHGFNNKHQYENYGYRNR